MMQKDEVALLPAWLAYHTRLFGAENLLVIDNGSQLPAIRAQLDSAKRRGVTVIIRPERKHFENKGRVIQEAVASLGCAPDAVFPIDCDEFLGVSREGSFTSSRSAFFSEVERFLDSGRAVGRIASAYWNIPGSTGTYRHTHRKVFFRGDADVVLDRGFPTSTLRDGFGPFWAMPSSVK